ncbi:hypothetical protein [Pseudomonas putida]|uniref:hypothetical protein n=1 Tax=Pseudomonas putida TaxID=303 RepID=UPI0039060278
MTDGEPFSDEAYSSFIFRLALWHPRFSKSPEFVEEAYRTSLQRHPLDPDYYAASFFGDVAAKALEEIFPNRNFDFMLAKLSSFVMPLYYRRSYCFDCMVEQIKGAWSPAVLKRWGLVYYCVCDAHNIPLSDAPQRGNNKANNAQYFFCFHANRRSPVPINCFSDDALMAGLEVQRFMASIDVEPGLAPTPLLEFCRIVLEIFLYPDYGICNAPQARKGVSVHSPEWERSCFGPLWATILERQSAMLLLGWILGLPGVKLDFLPNQMGARIALAYLDQRGLGIAASFLPDSIYKMQSLRLCLLKDNMSLLAVNDFVEGFVSRLQG